MKLLPLTQDYSLSTFDCGDDDLNDFLLVDSKPSLDMQIANTYILEDNGRVVAYFCLLNDKISRKEITGSQWKKIRSKFPKGKQFNSYPSVKIGRFAVSLEWRGCNIGSLLMKSLKDQLNDSKSYSAYRFLTVDAYLSAIPFYEKNGFIQLNQKDENKHTRLMFFDMMEIA